LHKAQYRFGTDRVFYALRARIFKKKRMAESTKSEARAQAFVARKLAHSQMYDPAACAQLSTFLAGIDSFTVIAAYMPIRTEVSPLPVMADLAAAGKIVCVPVIEAAGKPLKFSRWTPETVMVNGPFGAKIPKTDAFVIPDVLITPLVAFDARGYRLGYGGGFYDRTFELLRLKGKALAVGFAYQAQELAFVPTEPTDVRLDAIVTEKGVKRF
jgi:5-formyltetrahydrofolate cyclo-ligase